MSYPHFGNVPANSTLYVPFQSFSGTTGASITISNLAVGDIKIYKNGGVVQRSVTNGYTLLDTDGIDFDGITGIHGFSVDLSDNTDAGFYSAGDSYFIVVDNVTIDTQTVSFIACAFRIVAAEATAGTPGVDVLRISGDATAADNLEAALDGTGGVTITANLTGAITGNITGNLSGSVGSVTGNVGGNVTGSVGSVTGNVAGNVTGSVGSLATQAKADVNAEVVDALSVDTYAEPGQGNLAATSSLASKIGYLFKFLRNRTTQTASQLSVYNDDAVTIDHKAACSDDTITADRGEFTTGP